MSKVEGNPSTFDLPGRGLLPGMEDGSRPWMADKAGGQPAGAGEQSDYATASF